MDSLPESILWTDIQDHANFLVNVYAKEYRNIVVADPHEKLRRDMYVYHRDDLRQLLALDRYERIARGKRRRAVKRLFTG